MFDYLYYKLYQASLKSSLSDIPQYTAPIYFGGLISANLLVLNAFLAKFDLMPFLFSSGVGGISFVALLIVLTILYFRKDRSNRIVEKYSGENKSQKIKGNAIVAIYVAVSFLLIFAIAFFRPGKL